MVKLWLKWLNVGTLSEKNLKILFECDQILKLNGCKRGEEDSFQEKVSENKILPTFPLKKNEETVHCHKLNFEWKSNAGSRLM